IAEKNDYLQITPPAMWSLDNYATWCGSCELLEGDKVKIMDHMKKRLEKTKNNIYIKDDIRKKATDLYEDFQLSSQYQTKKQLELVENQKIIELAEIERMKIHQHVADGFVEFSKEMTGIKKRTLEDSESKSSDVENTASINDGETTPTKRTKLSDEISTNSEFTFESIESTNYDFGLGNYEEGTEIDPDLSFQETDEDLAMHVSEQLFNEDTWNQWRLCSGEVISDLLVKSANKKGHPLRPEVWGIVRCGFKIAKPGWCSADDYAEIQRFTRRATVSSCSGFISKLLKFKSLESLEKNIKEIRLLNNFNEIIKEDSRKLILEELKTSDILFPLQDPFEKFFIKILSIFQRDIFPDNSVIQQPNVSESNYGSYMVHPFLKCTFFGMEKFLHYHVGEIALSSVKSCRERRQCNTLFEQKADGSHFDEEKGITLSPLPEIEHISTQAQRGESLDSSESSTEPETSTTSLPQDIIDDDSVGILDFVETIHKEKISSEIRETNREKKLQKSYNNLTPPIQSETSTMSTPESLDLKPGTENITQVIADGIQDNNLLDSNHVTEISATALHQNSSTVLLLDLAQLFDKATDAEHYAMKANQEETLCWISYGKEF
ncbi:11170_t:CDS:10, partial [Gigaspora margarita]